MPRRISADGFRRGLIESPDLATAMRRNASLRWHCFHHVWRTARQKGRLMTYQASLPEKRHAPKFQALRSDGYGVNALDRS